MSASSTEMQAPLEQSDAPEQHQQQPQTNEQSTVEQEQPCLVKKSISSQLDVQWQTLKTTSSTQEFCQVLKEYCVAIVQSPDEQLFMSYFVENKLLSLLHEKIRAQRQNGELLRTTFSLFEFLLKALKKEEELVFFLVKINQENFITEQYKFTEEEDEAYYANFLKLMIRKINEDHRYLNVFLNSREPHFPLLLQLLKMHNCKDDIMHTSSKLAIMEISNNKDPIVASYLSNFPFVLFYPLYVGIILDRLKAVLDEDSQINVEKLHGSLRYLQQFVENKDRYVIDMYTNSFMKIVGNYIYDQLTRLNEKNNIKKGVHLLRVLLRYVLPEVSVVKIKISLFCLFSTNIPSKMRKCFEAKTSQLETKYWIPQACSQEIIKHCKAIFYTGKQVNSSFIKTINSYIPRSKDNWLYYEVKKISEIVGYKIHLQEPINTQKPLPHSFLEALWTMIDDHAVRNQVFCCIYKLKNEQIMFYYLKVLTELFSYGNTEDNLEFEHIVQVLTSCTSLSLVHSFYNIVIKSQMQVEQSDYLQMVYRSVTEKLVHFVLTKGWKEMLLRIKDSYLQQNNTSFAADIYREMQCQLLLFVSLRTLLGTENDDCSPFIAQKWEQYAQMTCETIFKCRDSNANGSKVFAILDGQFLNFKDRQEKIINKEELLLTDLKFYEEGEKVEVIGGEKSNNFFISLQLEPELRKYLLREVSHRRELAQRISLELRQLRFELSKE